MAADRTLRDGDDAEGLGAGQGGEHAAFGDAEHWPRGRLAADMQARIAVAGDDERRGPRVILDQAPQRHRNAVDIGLALDTERSFGKSLADEFRPLVYTHG